MKTNRARKYFDKAIAPLVRAGRKRPALYVQIAQAMTAKSGDHFHRQEVAEWLHEDSARRTEPRLGAGLLLIRVGTDLLGNGKKKANKK